MTVSVFICFIAAFILNFLSKNYLQQFRSYAIVIKSIFSITKQFTNFYGSYFQPEQQILQLSDSFEKKQEHPSLELTVVIYNINFGHNQELLESCHLLKEYAQYVAQVRTYAKEADFPKAVEQAVAYCIRNGILTDFLTKNRAEVIAVSIFEYDEEKHMKNEREEWREIGLKEGLAIGHEKGVKTGVNNLSHLLKSLQDNGETKKLQRALSDNSYLEQLYQEYFSKDK